MKMIEIYTHTNVGYNPLFIREGWQVAKLNPLAGHGLNEIDKVEVHNATDEIFILIRGVAMLIAAKMDNYTEFEVIRMKPAIIYNIPKGRWHNIAMGDDAELIIVEKDYTHLHDCLYKNLDESQQNEVKQHIQKLLN